VLLRAANRENSALTRGNQKRAKMETDDNASEQKRQKSKRVVYGQRIEVCKDASVLLMREG
jgi:hypothetical protein